MLLKEYFDKLPNRLSANFFAMIGFLNILIFVPTAWKNISSIFYNIFFMKISQIFWGVLISYTLNVFMFGIILLISFIFLFYPFWIFSKNNKNNNFKYFILCFCFSGILISFLFIKIHILTDTALFCQTLLNIYKNIKLLLVFVYFVIFVLFFINKLSMPQNFNNNFYKFFVLIFYHYFLLLYFSFLIFLILSFSN